MMSVFNTQQCEYWSDSGVWWLQEGRGFGLHWVEAGASHASLPAAVTPTEAGGQNLQRTEEPATVLRQLREYFKLENSTPQTVNLSKRREGCRRHRQSRTWSPSPWVASSGTPPTPNIRYRIKYNKSQSHSHSNTTITWLSKILLHSKMKGKVTYRTSSKF